MTPTELTGVWECPTCRGDGKCHRCKGHGWVKAPSESAALDLLQLAFASAGLAKKTDRQIADALEKVWPKLPVIKMESSIVSEAIDRLRRSEGGPMEHEDE